MTLPETLPNAETSAAAATVRAWMVRYISAVIDVPQDPFPETERFDQYGLDSVEITIMCGIMEEEFGVRVDPAEVFDHPSVAALANHLAARGDLSPGARPA